MPDFLRWLVTTGHSPDSVAQYIYPILQNGCIGLTLGQLIGGSCVPPPGKPFPYRRPENVPGTTCFAIEKGTSIPQAVLNHKCGEGEEKKIFAQQGTANPQIGPPPGGQFPPNVMPVSPTPSPSGGYFNYILYHQGWYLWIDHQFYPGNNPPQTVTLCDHPYSDPNRLPDTVWCVNCKQKCPTNNTVPVIIR